MKEPKKTVYLQLPLPLYAQLSQLAQENVRTLPGYIRQVLRLYVKHLEEGQNEEDWWYFRGLKR